MQTEKTNVSDFPLISVVIPVYNVESYLSACLDSICGQTYRNLEIILVDDGSRDKSGGICDAYAETDSRIICIHKENGGLSSARNCGMEQAHGEYIMFVDSDDWIELDTVERAVLYAKNENADVVMWNYIREYEEKSLPTTPVYDQDRVWRGDSCREVYLRMIGPRGEQLANPAVLDSLSSACMKLYRRDMVMSSNIRFVDHAVIGSSEDALFHIQLFRSVRCAVYMTVCLYHYRKTNSTSITSRINRSLWNQRKNMFSIAKESLDEGDSEALETLQNRIACSLIGLGLVMMHPSVPKREVRSDIRSVLRDPLYRSAVKQLRIRHMPIHWKVFFLCAKIKWLGGVYLLLKSMKFMKGRV